jgi:putative membrane protein
MPSLSAGIKALAKGASQLSAGIGAATEGTGKLKDGIEQLNDEGIQKIVDAYHDNLDGLSDRLKATVEAGKAYNTFSGKSDDMQGSVKFIYETEAIEIADEDTD